MRVFHLTTADDWEAAQAAGAYTVSTRGVSLEEEGYIHCSRAEQVAAVRQRFYADVPDLVLLEVETDLLTSPWRVDPVGDDTFPHVYGPLDLAAVVGVTPLWAPPRSAT